jgi:2-polyprenyl-6-methoxyphenol hydroxylase-like FAD-dependent oxidoreductase
MSRIKRVLIVGGGIGGLCTAIGLARAGIKADIIEIKTDWTVYGVGIIQPSNQLRALEELGLAKVCVERGAAFNGWEIYDQTGHLQAQIPTPNTSLSQYPPINGIARPALHEVLMKKAAAGGTRVRLGLTVDKIYDGPDAVSVRLSNGAVERYDFLIGADGTYSKVRALLFGEGLKPIYNGLCVWRYNFPRPPAMMWGSVHYGRKAKVGLVPMSPTLMYMFVVTPEPGNRRIPPPRLHDEMRSRIEGFTGVVAMLREHITDPAGVVRRPMEPMLLPAPWHRQRALLIGDAAHATTPQLAQGASMAIEDAALLAQLLPQDRPLADILAEFMRRRYARSELVVETSRKLGEWELAEFEGRPVAGANHTALMTQAGLKLAEAY